MSKYIIEIKPEYEDSFKGLMILGAKDSNLFVDTLAVENLEELNSDYINEHFGQLQDEAYKRGFEDGKWKSEDGCTGCQYEGKVVTGPPCITCCNSYRNQWTAKKQDDEIRVGDVVRWKDKDINDGLALITWIGGKDGKQCNVMCDDGSSGVWNTDEFVKTDRHVDIESILEDMRE